jgi:hypothetical protein
MMTDDRADSERHVPVEISVASDADERPSIDSNTRVDVEVDGQMYPTARLEDGRYVAWWFDTDAPAVDDPMTTEWVTAPTRFLAAGTLHELWENPAAFDAYTGSPTPDP